MGEGQHRMVVCVSGIAARRKYMRDLSIANELIAIKSGVTLAVLAEAGLLPLWQRSLEKYLEILCGTEIRAIILDYDGTVYAGGQRDNAYADGEMLNLLAGLLDQGLYLGFASGRGASLRDALRHSFAEKYWTQIFCAYQDGAETGSLADNNLPTPRSADLENESLVQVRHKLEHVFAGWPGAPDMRPENELLGIYGPEEMGGRIFAACCAAALPLGLKVFHGGRMTDITLPHVSKRNLLHVLPGPCLAIGDAGAWPGNDCELLASPLGVSSGSVSADPDFCWRLTRETGVAATKAVLRNLRSTHSSCAILGFPLTWK